MAIINGKALVKDGKPLDRVYSNGKLVYGRNLLNGTKDFSGTWSNAGGWTNDGTYKGLTVKKKNIQGGGIFKSFTAPKDGTYTFSAYVKGSGNTANIMRYGALNSQSAQAPISKSMGNNFDWTRDIITLDLKADDKAWFNYSITGTGTDSAVWNAGHKWESGSIATPWAHAPEDYI